MQGRTRCHPIHDPSLPDPRPVVTRSQPSSFVARPVVARNPPSLPEQHPSSPDPISIVGCCILVVARFFLNFHTRRHALRTRRHEVRDPLSRPFPRPPRTRLRQPYKYARVFFFPYTLSKHPGLHLPRRLLAGFSKGC